MARCECSDWLAFAASRRDDTGVSTRPPLPRNVWVLGFVSLLMDLSSEIYHALLPAFITMVLGLPATALGAIDGVAEATANLAKLFSGRLSDRSLKRKPVRAFTMSSNLAPPKTFVTLQP